MVKVVKIPNDYGLNSRDSESPNSCPVASASPSSTPPTFLLKEINVFILAVLGSLLPRGLFSSCWERGLLSSCSAQASHYSGFFYRRAQAPGLLSSCCSWAQQSWSLGSRTQVRQLWCIDLDAPRHVGPSLLDHGSNPCLLPWQADSLLLRHQHNPTST